jgi:cytochrome c oxidase subunit 3
MTQARRPAVPNVVLATALLMIAEIMLFGGLASAYLVLRGQAGAWPPLDQPRLPVLATAFSTALLVLSGISAWRAVAAARTNRPDHAGRLVKLSFGLGAAFFLLQGWEWAQLLRQGLTTSSSLYGSLFYTIIGCHALHVAGGLTALAFVAARARREGWTADTLDALTATRLFWTFVVAVWPPLYALVYLW